jgi:hypothetical protein
MNQQLRQQIIESKTQTVIKMHKSGCSAEEIKTRTGYSKPHISKILGDNIEGFRRKQR